MDILSFIKVVKDYKKTLIIDSDFYNYLIKNSIFSTQVTSPYTIMPDPIYSALELREGKDLITVYFRNLNDNAYSSFKEYKFLICGKLYKTRKEKFLCEYNSELELIRRTYLGKKHKMVAPSVYIPASVEKNGKNYNMVFYFKRKFMTINSEVLLSYQENQKFDPFNFKVNEDQLRIIEMFSL